MALRGTLKDFGIADILQLISHQGKSGILSVKGRGQEIRVHFETGNVINCENTDPKRRDFIGSMLVRGGCISEGDLANCLSVQKETGRKLGDLLVETTPLSALELNHFIKLQIAETVYGLFLWENGTYAFTQTEEINQSGVSLRTENVLMEGLRQVDEWPLLRRFLRNYSMTFQKVAPLDDHVDKSDNELDDWDLADTLKGLAQPASDVKGKKVGETEIKVYNLITADRDVQKIVDLSRMGEFEACRALATLLELKIIVVSSDHESRPSAHATVGGISTHKNPRVTRLMWTAVVLGMIFAGSRLLEDQQVELWGVYERLAISRDFGFRDTTIEGVVGEAQMARLRHFLELYRTQYGEYPSRLKSLSDHGFVHDRELSYPWNATYHYSRVEDGFRLERPLY